jgi:hypothetical protein
VIFTWVDWAIVAVVAISSLISLSRGFVKEALSLLTWIIAGVVAWMFGGALAQHLGEFTETHVASGRDPQVGPAGRTLAHFGRGVRFGFPQTAGPLRDPGGRRLARLDDPLRFNNSDVASFGPLGTATPGSLYLTAGDGTLACVRVTSRTGRVRVLVRDPRSGDWR